MSCKMTRVDNSAPFIFGTVIVLFFIIACISNSLTEIIIVLFVIISCISNRLTEKKAGYARNEKMGRTDHPNSSKQHSHKGHKWDMGEKDLQVLATILSAGLVDADPTTLHHLKEYRDLRGGST